MKSSLHLIDVDDLPKNDHRFFVEGVEEGKEFNPAKKLNTHESLLNRKSNRMTIEQLENLKVPDWVDEEYLKVKDHTKFILNSNKCFYSINI